LPPPPPRQNPFRKSDPFYTPFYLSWMDSDLAFPFSPPKKYPNHFSLGGMLLKVQGMGCHQFSLTSKPRTPFFSSFFLGRRAVTEVPQTAVSPFSLVGVQLSFPPVLGKLFLSQKLPFPLFFFFLFSLKISLALLFLSDRHVFSSQHLYAPCLRSPFYYAPSHCQCLQCSPPPRHTRLFLGPAPPSPFYVDRTPIPSPFLLRYPRSAFFHDERPLFPINYISLFSPLPFGDFPLPPFPLKGKEPAKVCGRVLSFLPPHWGGI